MKELFYEEFYKLQHKRSTWYTPFVLFGAMLAVGFISRHSSTPEWYILAAFAGTQWVVIIMIVACATTTSMEYEYGTIKHLVIADRGKVQIFLSKFLLIMAYDAYLHSLAFIFTFPVKWLVYGTKYPFTEVYDYGETLFHLLVTECLVDFLGSVIIIGMILLLSCAAKSAAVAIAIGITVTFIGEGVSNMIIRGAGKEFPIIRWNPFNMLNMTNEWGNPGYYDTTLLTMKQLVIGNLSYSLLFILVAFLAFTRKRI